MNMTGVRDIGEMWIAGVRDNGELQHIHNESWVIPYRFEQISRFPGHRNCKWSVSGTPVIANCRCPGHLQSQFPASWTPVKWEFPWNAHCRCPGHWWNTKCRCPGYRGIATHSQWKNCRCPGHRWNVKCPCPGHQRIGTPASCFFTEGEYYLLYRPGTNSCKNLSWPFENSCWNLSSVLNS